MGKISRNFYTLQPTNSTYQLERGRERYKERERGREGEKKRESEKERERDLYKSKKIFDFFCGKHCH